ncbi:MAG: hypothetical protein ABS69_11605 [Nitrosomonadales bacterium SCN 54-20]|nr:MAG: hypothetical protein ABS69_11605 [Nitrosomonadales bacterium SCN 54-20]
MSTSHIPNHWGQLAAGGKTTPERQAGLPPDIAAHITALTAPDSEPVPAKTLLWVRASMREYVSGMRRLDEVMNLAPSAAQRNWRTIDRFEARNTWIVRAFELIDGTSDYKRCGELSEYIVNFHDGFWPSWKDLALPPEDTTPLRCVLFFAFKFGNGFVPRDWRQLMKIVQKHATASCTSSILLHVHADKYDQPRSTITINPSTHTGKSYMDILGKLAVLVLHAWSASDELRARHCDDLTDYHERVLRQAMDCDDEKGELPPLITDVLSQEQIENALRSSGLHISTEAKTL